MYPEADGHAFGVLLDRCLQDPACIALMERFIARNPELWNEDIGE